MAGKAGRLIRSMMAAALSLGIAAATPDPVTSLAGRYSYGFTNGTVDGDRYHSEDVVEIVPVDGSHAYLRFSLDFFNAHNCDFAGIAEARGDMLVYQSPDAATAAGPACRLAVRRSGARLTWNDDGSCNAYCGARGGFVNGHVPWRSRRVIRHIARLKASPDYREAMSAWHRR